MPPKKLRRRGWWPTGLFRVSGHSMEPTFKPGDTLLGWKWSWRMRPGQILVFAESGLPHIKRLTEIRPDGSLIMVGDNLADSRDSRQFGAVPHTAVIARIIIKIP